MSSSSTADSNSEENVSVTCTKCRCKLTAEKFCFVRTSLLQGPPVIYCLECVENIGQPEREGLQPCFIDPADGKTTDLREIPGGLAALLEDAKARPMNALHTMGEWFVESLGGPGQALLDKFRTLAETHPQAKLDLRPILAAKSPEAQTEAIEHSFNEFYRFINSDTPAALEMHRFFRDMILTRHPNSATIRILQCEKDSLGVVLAAPAARVVNDYSLYTTLDEGSREIRLLRLSKGNTEDPIIGTIMKAAHPWHGATWSALSYCWGDLQETRKMILRHAVTSPTDPSDSCEFQEQVFNITANLEMALRELRNADADTWLWVDALCINQGDFKERDSQVKIMRDIYAEASSVAIWLGPSKNDHLNYDFMNTLDHRIANYLQKHNMLLPASYGEVLRHFTMECWKNRRRSDPLVDPARIATLRGFFDNSWFRRVWVLQEVWSASGNIEVFGKDRLKTTWHAVKLADTYLLAVGHYLNMGLPGLHGRHGLPGAWGYILDTSKDSPKGPYLPILKLFHMVNLDFKAGDLRDKLVALLAMGKETHQSFKTDPDLAPAYETKTEHQVFLDFSRWHIVQSRTLDVLASAGYTMHPEHKSADGNSLWPTWAVSCIPGNCLPRPAFHTLSKIRATILDQVDLDRIADSGNKTVLPVRGFRIGTIETKTPYHFHVDGHAEDETIQLISPNAPKGHIGGLELIWKDFSPKHRTGKTSCRVLEPGFSICSGRRFLDEILLTLTGGGREGHKHCDHDRGIHRDGKRLPHEIYGDFATFWNRVAPSENAEHDKMGAFCEHVRELLETAISQVPDEARERRYDAFLYMVFHHIHGRSLFVTESDQYGLCPLKAEEGDAVVALVGAKAPFVLRPRSDDKFEVIGECYVRARGMLNGKFIKEEMAKRQEKLDEFDLC